MAGMFLVKFLTNSEVGCRVVVEVSCTCSRWGRGDLLVFLLFLLFNHFFSSPEPKAHEMSLYYRLGLLSFVHRLSSVVVHTLKQEYL